MLNKCQFIGHVGKDPEIKSMNNGDQVANFSLACTEKWKSKSGEPQEKTEWINVVVFGKLCGVIERYVTKGSKLYLCGKMQTRSWEKDGQTKYMTELVLQGFGGELILLDSKGGGGQQDSYAKPEAARRKPEPELDDEIPFIRW